jgi:hypothetical protein
LIKQAYKKIVGDMAYKFKLILQSVDYIISFFYSLKSPV